MSGTDRRGLLFVILLMRSDENVSMSDSRYATAQRLAPGLGSTPMSEEPKWNEGINLHDSGSSRPLDVEVPLL